MGFLKVAFMSLMLLAVTTSCIDEGDYDCEMPGGEDDGDEQEMVLAAYLGDMVQAPFGLPLDVGDKIGSFTLSNGILFGPNTVEIVEVRDYIILGAQYYMDRTSLNTFFMYYPFVPYLQSMDLSRKKVPDIPPVQSPAVPAELFGVIPPVSYYWGESVIVPQVYNIFTRLVFSMNAGTSGIVVEKIEVKAPEDKILAFSGGVIDITRRTTQPGFGEVRSVTPGSESSTVVYDPGDGGLAVPDSFIETVEASVVVLPFDILDETLSFVITTNKGEFTLTVGDMQFRREGSYMFPIRFVEEPV